MTPHGKDTRNIESGAREAGAEVGMNWLWAVVALGAGILWVSTTAFGEARVGFAEEFDDFDGWQTSRNWPHGDPFESVEVKDGVVTVKTHCGALDYRTVREDWPEWPKQPYADFVSVSRTYDQPVDFDRYHYVVLRLRLKGTFVEMSVNGIGTVCDGPGVGTEESETQAAPAAGTEASGGVDKREQ
jgi:hypothetical protein